MANPNLRNFGGIQGKIAVDDTIGTAGGELLLNTSNSGYVYKINAIFAANVSGSDVLTSVSYYSGSDHYLARYLTVPAGSTQVISTKETYFYLEEGHSIKAISSARAVDFIICYEILSPSPVGTNLRNPTDIFGKSYRGSLSSSLSSVLSQSNNSYSYKINSIFLANKSSTSCTADVRVVETGSDHAYLVNDLSIPGGSTQIVSTKETYFYLPGGSSIQASASNSNVDIIIGYEEIRT
jgi:hypothetical protein